MSFFDQTRTENTIESTVRDMELAAMKKAAKGCSVTGCECSANWQSFKKDPTYDNYMRAHRVKVGKMEATTPPGMKDMISHCKAEHKEISNPHALAWYVHEKKGKK